MSLLIALIMIDGFGLPAEWKSWAFILWIGHLIYHWD